MLVGMAMIDTGHFRKLLEEVGIADVRVYIVTAVYWIVINSLLEEYVWRWFVVNQCRRLSGFWTAVMLSAAMFTLHHIIAMKVYFGWVLVCLAGAGIFAAAALWSWIYAKYRSIWPGYVSHAIVDAALFAIGYWLLFC
jgi:membrane protease YdiL (CAAX protease family)